MEQPPEITSKFTSYQKRTISRVLSAIILCPVVAFFFSRMEASQAAMSKAEFLASQSIRYDTLIAQQPSVIVSILAGTLFVCIFIGVYELLALVIHKLMILISDKEKLNNPL